MTSYFDTLANSTFSQALGWTLFHSLWQLTIVAAIAAVILRVTATSCAAKTRYIAACLCLLLMTWLPILTFGWLLAGQPNAASSPITTISIVPSAAESPEQIGPTKIADDVSPISLSNDAELAHAPSPPPSVSSSPYLANVISPMVERWLPIFVSVWLLGVILGSIRTLFGFQRALHWKRKSTSIKNRDLHNRFNKLASRLKVQNVVLRRSLTVSAPAVIGFFKPVVLVPVSLLTNLTPAELDAILVHELAHIKRNDYAINLLQTVVETLLFFHPAVWWLSRRIRIERELCCDDRAIQTCHDPILFAKALAKLEVMRCEPNELLVAANGGSILERIRRLTAEPACPQRSSLPLIATLLTLTLTGLGVATATATSSAAKAHVLPASVDAPTQDPVEAERPTKKSEVVQVDSKTGLSQRVFADIELSAMTKDGKTNSTKISMKYSNVISYSLIPAKTAKKLDAIVIGEIDFGKTRLKRDQNRDLPFLRAPEKANPTPEETAAEKLKHQWALAEVEYQELTQSYGPKHPKIVAIKNRMDALQEALKKRPTGPQRFTPDPNDPVWLPGHLSTYGMNPTRQHKFQIVAIQQVDLGIGPAFGPVVALVSNDENSEFGLFGRDWSQQVLGENGEQLSALPDGTLHYVVGENAKYFQRQKKQPAKQGDQPNQALPKLKIIGGDSPIKEAIFAASKSGRSANDMLKHMKTVSQISGHSADRTINMETILSVKPRYWFGEGGTDADEVNLNLPEGSKTRAWFQGERIDVVEKSDHVQILITNGKLRWIDPVGVTRVELFPDGGAEQLSVKAFFDADEIVMIAKSKWLDPKSEQEIPPVVVRLNTETGATKGEEDPPHGSIRYGIQYDKEKPILRLKMKWYYVRERLEEEAAAEDKKREKD